MAMQAPDEELRGSFAAVQRWNGLSPVAKFHNKTLEYMVDAETKDHKLSKHISAETVAWVMSHPMQDVWQSTITFGILRFLFILTLLQHHKKIDLLYTLLSGDNKWATNQQKGRLMFRFRHSGLSHNKTLSELISDFIADMDPNLRKEYEDSDTD